MELRLVELLNIPTDLGVSFILRLTSFSIGCWLQVSLDEQNTQITQTMQLPGGTLSFVGVFTVPTKTKTKSIFHCIGGTGEFQTVTEGTAEVEVYSFNQISLDTILTITVYYHKGSGQR